MQRLMTALRRWLDHPRATWRIVILSLVLLAPCLTVGLCMDDYNHRAMLQPDGPEWGSRAPHAMYEFMPDDDGWRTGAAEAGFLPWFADSQIHARFWRPIASLSLYLDHVAWPDQPVIAHAHSMLWYAALCALTALLFRRLFDEPWVGALAALVFAIDDAHAGAVAWIANRNSVIAMTFAVAALWFHVRWRQDGDKRAALAAPLALALGLWSAEMALAITAYLFAYAVFLDRGTWAQRAATLLPCAAVSLGWRAAYSAFGYGAGGSALYIDPMRSPVHFAKAASLRLPVLLQAQLTPITSDFSAMSPAVMGATAALSLITVTWTAVAVHRRVRENAAIRFAVLGMVLSAVPLCAVFAADRLLFPTGIGAAMLIAATIAFVYPTPGREKAHPNWLSRVAAWGFIVTHLIFAPLFGLTKPMGVKQLGEVYQSGARSGEKLGKLEGRTMVVLSAPDFFFPSLLGTIRLAWGKRGPKAVRLLGSGLTDVTVTRLGPRRLGIRAAASFQNSTLDRLLRHPDRPLRVGDRHALSDLAVTVRELDAQGRPNRIEVELGFDPDDPRYVWTVFTPNGFEPVTLPPPGQAIDVPGLGEMTQVFNFVHDPKAPATKLTPRPVTLAAAAPVRPAQVAPAAPSSQAAPSKATKPQAPPPPAKPHTGPTSSAKKTLSWSYPKTIAGPMHVVVDVPKTDRPLPVLIAMHGLGESSKGPLRGSRGWLDDYAIGKARDRLAAPPLTKKDFIGFVDDARLGQFNAGLKAQPYRGMILVFPYTPNILVPDRSLDGADKLASFLIDEVLPRVRRETPALATREATAVDGVSLGGRAALLVGLKHPETFGVVAGLQSAIYPKDLKGLVAMAKAARGTNPALRLRILTSQADFYRGTHGRLSAAWKAAAIDHQFDTVPGPHDYIFNRGPGSYEMLVFHDRATRGERFP